MWAMTSRDQPTAPAEAQRIPVPPSGPPGIPPGIPVPEREPRRDPEPGGDLPEPPPPPLGDPPADAPVRLREVGGPQGPEPTRYGDWERKGRVSDF
jgi:homeobox protein ESX1